MAKFDVDGILVTENSFNHATEKPRYLGRNASVEPCLFGNVKINLHNIYRLLGSGKLNLKFNGNIW